MTRPAQSSLVLDGDVLKLRLLAQRTEGPNVTRVDWLRFTCQLRDAPFDADLLFPPKPKWDNVWHERAIELQHALKELAHKEEFTPAVQALSLARQIVDVLGPEFQIAPEIRKGHDFYAHRWSITLEGKEAGWVGYGVSSASKNQEQQAKTIHANLYGLACTFAAPGWSARMADLIDEVQANITRVDLALDFFDGYEGGVDSVRQDYLNGLCNVGGKRPKCNMVGDWCNGQERSFYLGSKQAGKQTNIYEKGHQLYGPESGSNWLRFELRYGNKLRHLPSDALRYPDDFFAGASEWHSSVLHRLQGEVRHQPVPCQQRLAEESVDAEVHRNLTWIKRVAAPSISAALKYLSFEKLLSLLEHQKLPGRLSFISETRLRAAYSCALERFPVGNGPIAA